MRKKIIISIIFVIVLVIFFSTVNDNYFFNRAICREKKEKYILKLDAIVADRFIDSLNHNYKTLLLRDTITGHQTKLYIINESGGFYNNVGEGDLIKKEPKSLIIRNLTRNRIDTLKYNCITK